MLELIDLVPGKEVLGQYTITKLLRENGISSTFGLQGEEFPGGAELVLFPSYLFGSVEAATKFSEELKPWIHFDCSSVRALSRMEVQGDGLVLQIGEQVPGPSLREFLAEGELLTSGEVQMLGLRLLDGLEALHGAGLVHGDLKPEVVFGNGDPETAMIIDGGVTPSLWSTQHLGARTQLVGTPFYAPIEQFSGDAPSAGSDLYNLATLLYEAATGQLPWNGSGFIEVFQSKLVRPTEGSKAARAVDLAPGLDNLLCSALDPQRRERPQDASVFHELLTAALS